MDASEKQHNQSRTKRCILGNHGARELPLLHLICLHTHRIANKACFQQIRQPVLQQANSRSQEEPRHPEKNCT